MKTNLIIIAIIAAIALTGCGTIPATGPNPLDAPGQQPTAREIRNEHMSAITGNRAFRLR